MAALKSKTELHSWYNELKTSFKTQKISALSFENEIANNIYLLTTGEAKLTATKASLVIGILQAVVFDHLFTSKSFGDIAAMVTQSNAARVPEIMDAFENFARIQTQTRLEMEKETAVKPEEKKVFAKFPSKTMLEQWVSVHMPSAVDASCGIPAVIPACSDRRLISFYDEVEKYVVSLKLDLDRADVNYVDNILIIDYFISLVATREIPPQSYGPLVDELKSLYADPVKTPHIDALVERDQKPAVKQTAAQAAIERAISWREDEAKQNHHGINLLQTFAQQYCPVTTAKHIARTQLMDFVRDTTKKILLAIANPTNPMHSDFLLKRHCIDFFNVKHGVVGISTTIGDTGVIKMRIFAQRTPDAQQSRGLFSADQQVNDQSVGAVPMSHLIASLISLWDIPNQRPRFDNGNAQYGPTIEEHLLSVIGQEAIKYGITATFGTTAECILVVLH